MAASLSDVLTAMQNGVQAINNLNQTLAALTSGIFSSLVTAKSTTAPAAGGTFFIQLGSTTGFGIYGGTGAPTISAAQGSLYLRRDGSSTTTRAYVNTDGATGWTSITTAT